MNLVEQQEWVDRFLRSRAVSRRSALRGAAGALAALGGGGLLTGCRTPTATPGPTPSTAPVTFTGRRVSYGTDPTRTMAMSTELTGRPAGPILIDVGLDTGYGMTLTADVRQLVSLVPQEWGEIRAADQYFAHAVADGLHPGQSYHYRFRSGDGTTGPDAVFTTAPAGRAPFTFTAFGDHGVDKFPGAVSGFFNGYKPDDTRRTDRPAAALVGVISGIAPAFHLLAGDICYADPSGTGHPVRNNAPLPADPGFDNFDPLIWTRYFASIESSAAGTPWMFATGNHDIEALYGTNASNGATHGYGGHETRLHLPANGPVGCPSVYSFRHSVVGVISIDANELSTEITANTGYSNGAQLAWIRNTLAGMREDPAVEFIVAFFHHCAYSTVTAHASDGGVRSALAPLFDQYSVDLAVQGHNHAWERTNPLRGGRSTMSAPSGSTVHPATDGTTYICAGSAGRPRYAWQPGETDRFVGQTAPDSGTTVDSLLHLAGGGTQAETVDWSQARYLGYAVLAVDVVPGPPGGESTMTVRTITDEGKLIDTITLARPAPGAASSAPSSTPSPTPSPTP